MYTMHELLCYVPCYTPLMSLFSFQLFYFFHLTRNIDIKNYGLIGKKKDQGTASYAIVYCPLTPPVTLQPGHAVELQYQSGVMISR